MKIVFATGNPHKIKEVNQVLPDHFDIIGLKDIGCTEDIPETAPTIEGNALQKARYVRQNYGKDCFSEDTGLEVEALDGAPGVYTARYAGEARDAEANMQLMLANLKGGKNRAARFKTVIALILDGKEYLFEGICKGSIALQKTGVDGFGYDPIFIPEGGKISFAEMPAKDKNKISHRGRAMKKLIAFFETPQS